MAEKTGILRRKREFTKLDISAPLGDIRHIGHIGPEEYTPNPEFGMKESGPGAHAPPPCSGKVKDGSVDSSRSLSSDQAAFIDQSTVQTLMKDIQDLVISAVGVIDKAEEIKTRLDKIMTHDSTLPSVVNKGANRNRADTFDDVTEDVFIGAGDEAGVSDYVSLYENTVEGVAARSKQENKPSTEFSKRSEFTVNSDLLENSFGGVKSRDNQSGLKSAKTEYGEQNFVATSCAGKSPVLSCKPPSNSNIYSLKGPVFSSNQKSQDCSKYGTVDTDKVANDGDKHGNEDDPDSDDNDEKSEVTQIDNSIYNPIYPMDTSNVKIKQKTDKYQKLDNLMAMQNAGPFNKKPPANLYAKAEERECLSEALRAHVVDIVENVIFRESELPDMLTAESCITEDECENIRQIKNRRDQVRALISSIRGKDYTVLVRVVEKIGTTNPQIAQKIIESFEQYKKHYHRSLHCAKCKLTERINVKYVCDGLLAANAISDGLYNEIVFDTKPTGAQKILWNCVIDSINKLGTKHRIMTYDFVLQELSKKRYKYVSDHLKRAVANGKPLQCQCIILPSPRGSDPVDSFSPRSSSEVSRDSGNTELKEIVSEPEQSVKSPERDRKRYGMRNVWSLNEEDMLETISEQAEKPPGKKISKPKALPRVTLTKKPQAKDVDSHEDYSFA